MTRNAWIKNASASGVIAIPTALLETAFHSNAGDAAAIKEQKFRFYGARGILAGFIRYFKGVNALLPPLPPDRLTVTAEDCQVHVSWSPVKDTVSPNSDADRYNVYVSDDGILFDHLPALTVTVPEATLPIPRGKTLYVKVTAVNDAGESLDSMVGAARLASPGAKRVLFVDGVDRELKGAYDANSLRSYARIYVPAVTLNDPGDGLATVDDEVAPEHLASQNYDLVIWSTGNTSSKTDVLPSNQRNAIAALRSSGTPLVLSGAEIGYALNISSYNSDTSFLADKFGAAYVQDDSGDHTVQGFPGISNPLTFGTPVEYGGTTSALSVDTGYIEYPDVLSAAGGSTLLMTYANAGTGAAVLTADKRGVLVGFPLESIVDPAARECAIANLMATVLGTSVNSSCKQAAYQPVSEICGNGADDDCNGHADCADSVCASEASCAETTADAGFLDPDAGALDEGGWDSGSPDDTEPTETLPGAPPNGSSRADKVTLDGGCSAAGPSAASSLSPLLGLLCAGLRFRRRD